MKGVLHKGPGAKWWATIWYSVDEAKSMRRLLFQWPLTLGMMKEAQRLSDKYAMDDMEKSVTGFGKEGPNANII
jgi:hypothetical protein